MLGMPGRLNTVQGGPSHHMFSSTIARITAKREEIALQADHLEANAVAAAGNFSSLLVDDLNEELRQVYETQQLLERESRLLKGELASLTLQLSSWSVTTQQLLEALKHAGDLEHYIAVLSRQAAALAKVLSASEDPAAAVAQALQEKADLAGAAIASTAAQDSACSDESSVTASQLLLAPSQIVDDRNTTSKGDTSSAAVHCAAQQQQEEGDTVPQLPVSKRASR